MKKRKVWGIAPVLLPLVAFLCFCDRSVSKDFLGSAVVEARTYAVATTAQGLIVSLLKDEGQTLMKGELVALIDTVPLALAREGVESGIREMETSVSAKEAEIKSLATDVAGVEREFTRIEDLVKKGSATEQQRDNLGTQLQSAQMKLVAARRVALSLKEKQKGLAIKLREIEDKMERCRVKSPANGVVLTRYRNTGEVIGPGQPIMEIGEFDSLYADFFVPQDVLATLVYGQKIRIRIDLDGGASKEREAFVPATITWIGNEAEFSPKNIQTRQSRNELVFRVRATIPQSKGSLKRGLPVEVWR